MKVQQTKHRCMSCLKYPATQVWTDSTGRVYVCGYCYRRLRADAKAELKVLEAAAIVIDADAWRNAKEQDRDSVF